MPYRTIYQQNIIFIFSFILITYLFVGFIDNMFLFLTNIIILILTLVGMVSKVSRVYSLEKMIYLFFFFFFGVIPINDYLKNTIYWHGNNLDTDYLILTNIITIIGLLSFYFGAKIKLKIKYTFINYSINKFNKFSIFLLFILFIFIAFIILYINDFNIWKLLFRGLVEELYDIEESTLKLSQIEGLIYSNFIRPMPIYILFIYFFYYKDLQLGIKGKLLFFFFFFAAIFLIAPTAIARFRAAALYIPFVLIFTSIWKVHLRMQLSILGGLLVVLPILDKFRNFNIDTFTWEIDYSFLSQGHFDAYQNFYRVIEIDFISYGYQLLGSFFFFVPRSLWTDKPIGSGATLADLANYSFSNISMPFIAEGYVNFGLIGVVLFMFILGIILNQLDKKYWDSKETLNKKTLYPVYYYLLFGLIFFMMRGDLMSSFAFIIGLSVSFFFIIYLLNFFNKKIT